MCIHPAGWPFHAPTTAAARAESWRRQVRDSQESKGKRMAYALVRPRAATVAGARGSCESGGVDGRWALARGARQIGRKTPLAKRQPPCLSRRWRPTSGRPTIPPFSLRAHRGGRSGTGWWERPERPSRRTRLVRGRRGFRSHGLLARVLMAHGRAAPMGYVGLARGPLVAPRAVSIGYSACGRHLRPPRYKVLRLTRPLASVGVCH